jgi:osmotically-inducible protein OsmY
MGYGKEVSDRELQKSVDKKLLQRAGGSGSKISAAVSSGVVTLSGVLGQEYQRRALMSAMHGINGVKRVVDIMTIAPRKKREW